MLGYNRREGGREDGSAVYVCVCVTVLANHMKGLCILIYVQYLITATCDVWLVMPPINLSNKRLTNCTCTVEGLSQTMFDSRCVVVR